MRPCRPARACLVAVAALLTGAAAPASARILKTRQPGEYRELALVVGSGFEYETDSEESEYGFPFLVEYGFTKSLTLSVEPSYVVVRKKAGGSISGPADLETTATWEFPTERRYRPALAVLGTVKWPTASSGDLGTGEPDYSLGMIVSKELVGFDLDLNAVYTFVGSPPGMELRQTLETTFAAEWHLTPGLDVEGEFVTAAAAGGRYCGRPGTIASFANIGGPEQGETEYETTLGLAEYLGGHFKLEEGMVFKSGGSWQTVIGWEYDFGEGR